MNRAVRIALAVACGGVGVAAWSLIAVLTFMELKYGQTHGPSGFVLAAMTLPVAIAASWGMKRLLNLT